MKKLIKEFLEQFGTKVRDDEESSYVELMMDDHICIKWYGVEYYIPESNMMFTDSDRIVFDYLNDKHHI